ncbi:MAG: nucleotidyltransferase family protein [Janthinobacterium lividum]
MRDRPDRGSSPTTSIVGGLILAGGAGTRAAPYDKLLAPDATGQPMIARTIAQARASRLDRLVVVLGHDPDRIRRAIEPGDTSLPGIELSFAQAEDHAEGIAASLRCGIARAVTENWDAAMICLGDMPLVTTMLIDRLIVTYTIATLRPDAVLPLVGSRRGNPVLWDRRLFPDLLSLVGDTGARSLLSRPTTRILSVETSEAGALEDFDTPERLALFALHGR